MKCQSVNSYLFCLVDCAFGIMGYCMQSFYCNHSIARHKIIISRISHRGNRDDYLNFLCLHGEKWSDVFDRLVDDRASSSTRIGKKIMNEATNFLSKSINVLQEERAALVLDVEDGRCQIMELNKKIDELRLEAAKNDVRYQSAHSALGIANLTLTDRNKSISDLEIKLSQCRQEAIFATNDANNARSSLEDVMAQLKACESKYASRCAVLQQDLSDARSSNAVLIAKLEMTEGSLDAALRSLEDCRKVINQSNTLKEIVERGIFRLEKNIAESGSLLESSRDDLRTLLSRSKDISDKLFVASDAASDNATSIESRLGQLQEEVLTLASSTSLKSFSDETRTGFLDVMRTVDYLLEHHTKSITDVQQRLDDVARVQQSESLRQHLTDEDAQKQLGVIIELQRSGSVEVHAEVTNAEQRLKDFMMARSNELADVVESSVCKLDENIAKSGSLLESSRDDLQTLLSFSKEIGDKVSVASDASIHNATSIERRLGQLQEVISTLFTFPPHFMIRNGSNHRSRDRRETLN